MKKITVVLLEIAVISVFIFVALEIALRLFPGLIPLSFLIDFQNDLRKEVAAQRGLISTANTRFIEHEDGTPPLWVFQPGVTIGRDTPEPGKFEPVTMDDNGFCNPPEMPYGRDTIDVIVLGDSFAWCSLVESDETWPAILGSKGYGVYNLSVSGKGTYDYVQLLKTFGLAKSPKIVVMNIFGGNDITDDMRHVVYFNEDKKKAVSEQDRVRQCMIPEPFCAAYRGIKEGPIGRRSYAFNLIAVSARRGIVEARKYIGRHLEKEKEEKDEGFARELSFVFDGEVKDPRNFFPREAFLEKRPAGSPEVFHEPLVRFIYLSHTYKFVPVVLFTPYVASVYLAEPLPEELRNDAYLVAFQRKQAEYLAGQALLLGYRFLDLTPILREEARRRGSEELLYFSRDLHYTKLGHRVVAETIAPLIDAILKNAAGHR